MSVDRRNPTGDYYKNRDYLIAQEHAMFERCQQGSGLFLNLGCGMRLLDNFVNIDRYTQHPRIRNDDITDLHFDSGTVDLIFSAHSLEHIPHRLVRRTLKRWSEILCPGGTCWISMPDLDCVCQALLSNRDPHSRTWLRYTLLGFQAPQGSPDDCETIAPGEFHLSGYAAWEMEQMLADVDIVTEWNYRYDGWSTPSFFILGRKQ